MLLCKSTEIISNVSQVPSDVGHLEVYFLFYSRYNRNGERALNTETFGVSSVNHLRTSRGRGRGRWRWRGRGRGGEEGGEAIEGMGGEVTIGEGGEG